MSIRYWPYHTGLNLIVPLSIGTAFKISRPDRFRIVPEVDF